MEQPREGEEGKEIADALLRRHGDYRDWDANADGVRIGRGVMDEELKGFMLERYKALCARMDELRELGRHDEADKLLDTEVKMLLEILLREGMKEGEHGT
jgi:hypothetical protein